MVVTDIPSEFLHNEMNEKVHMQLEVTIPKLIVKFESNLYLQIQIA